ncbi:MAG: uroporphyrinogen decarboxylase family protein [Verrucomicrobiae bacterium]|nr:uroporphyrinogen decarboxylase family protein [Verrucomicrobiae bacterium]
MRAYLGVKTNTAVLDALDIDLRWITIPFMGPPQKSAIPLATEGTDFWGCHTRKAANVFNTYLEFDYHPLAHATSVAEVEAYDWPSLDWFDYSKVQEAIEEQCQTDRRAILFFAGGAFETPWYLRGMESFMMDLHENTGIANAICCRVESFYRTRALKVLEYGHGKIDLIGSGGDIGAQRGMMLSPATWREQIKPYTGRLIQTFKDLGLKTFYHSCGSLVPVIDDLIECGLDFLDPIQVTAKGMSPEELFPRFGERLSFHGAIDEVNLLPHATATEIYAETTRIIDLLGQNGGFIVSPSHQVQGDTPPENIVAIYEAARNYRFY